MLSIKHEQFKLFSKTKDQKSNQAGFLFGTNSTFFCFNKNYIFSNNSVLSWAYI